MNFPMEVSFFRLIFWLINTPGVGGLVVITIAGGMATLFGMSIHWVLSAGKTDDEAVYSFPTSSLLEEE